jgi:hypothetical protein
MKLKEKKLSMKTNKNHIVNDQIEKKNNLKKRKKKAYACKPGGPPCLEKKEEKKTQTHEPREAHVPIPTLFFFMVDQRVLDQKCIVKN